MDKIALVTCYFQKNYGSALQAYALQKVLDDMDISNETICFDGLEEIVNRKKKKHYLKQIFNLDVLKGKLGYINIRLRKKNPMSKLGKLLRRRDNAFLRFRDYFRLSSECNSFEILSKEIEKYSAVIVGSDQLWLPSNMDADYYTLNWVPDNIKKISYSTSFGIASLPEGYNEFAKSFLSRINFLSVREETGRKIIEKIGLNAKVVCDPTMLLTAEQWLSIQPKEPICKEEYIFCYFLGDNPEQREFVKRLKKKTGYKIVAIIYLNVYARCDKNFADETPFDVDPVQFLNYIYHAKYVCTDSFHASVFSILFHKQFFTFRRFKPEYTLATNSRIDTLLKAVDLEERLLTGMEDVDDCILLEFDTNKIERSLSLLRSEGRTFIWEALHGRKEN